MQENDSFKMQKSSLNLGLWTWDMLTNSMVLSDETYRIFGEISQSFIPTFERFMSHLSSENSLRAYYFFVIQWSVIIIVTIFYVGVVFIARLLQ